MGVAAGCGSDSAVATRPNYTENLWSLTIDQRAVTLAANTTLQLTTTPRNGSGATLASPPAATFHSSDSTKVTVDANGLLHGIAPTAATTVTATMTVDGVTKADTINVVVTATKQAFKSLAIQAGAAKVAVGSSVSAAATATDSSGLSLYGLSIRYWVSDVTIATIGTSGYVAGVARGSVWVYASTTSYGVTSRDSVQYTVTNPSSVSTAYYGTTYLTTFGAFYHDTVFVGAGGTVTVANYTTTPTAFNFGADSLKVTGGNISTLATYQSASRTFPTEGRYYIYDPAGHTGLIVVLPP
jgi:hypothetical protein